MLGAVAGLASEEGVEVEGMDAAGDVLPGLRGGPRGAAGHLGSGDDRRHRRARRGGQEHRGARRRRRARLHLPRLGRDVPRRGAGLLREGGPRRRAAPASSTWASTTGSPEAAHARGQRGGLARGHRRRRALGAGGQAARADEPGRLGGRGPGHRHRGGPRRRAEGLPHRRPRGAGAAPGGGAGRRRGDGAARPGAARRPGREPRALAAEGRRPTPWSSTPPGCRWTRSWSGSSSSSGR